MLKVALIGLGKQILSDHIPTLIRRKDIKIVGYFDPSQKSVGLLQETYPKIFERSVRYNNISEIKSGDIDFAIVAVPHNKYIPIINYFVNNEIYFMKEKPLSRSCAELKEIKNIKLFEKYCFVCTQRRFNPLYIQAKNLIPKIGVPYAFDAQYKLNIQDPQSGWRGNIKEAGGGCILDMGYHIVDQLLGWFGTPDKSCVYKSSLANGKGKKYAEDSAIIAFGYNSGLHGSINLMRSYADKFEEYQLSGSKGFIIGNKKRLVVKNREGKIIFEDILTSDDAMFDAQLGFFVKRAKSRGSFKEIIDRNINNMRFIDSCYKK